MVLTELDARSFRAHKAATIMNLIHYSLLSSKKVEADRCFMVDSNLTERMPAFSQINLPPGPMVSDWNIPRGCFKPHVLDVTMMNSTAFVVMTSNTRKLFVVENIL